MSVNWKRGTPLLSVSVFCLAGWLLFHELRAYHWHDIRQSVEAIPLSSIVLCVLLATANYVILIGYDLLALRAIDKKLPLRQVAFASFTGYVASYNFGATLGGLPMRYRLYSSLGLSAVDIVRLMMILGITFWIGLFTAGGLVFVIDPFRIPSTLSLPFQSIRGLGVALLAIVSVYVLMTVLWRKPLRIRGHEMQLPSTQLTFAQMALATTDLMVAAACLFVLCPADIGLSYSQFLGVYLLALVAVIMTHVPGGVGVLELVMLTMTKSPNPQALVAAMMVFRVIYYLLPLLVATLMLGVTEYRLHRRHVDPWMGQLGQAITSVLPSFVAGLTFCAGIVLILSGATPTASDRLPLLYRLIPLSLVESSHFVGSVVGAALLLVARGLQRRLDSVWWMAVDLVGVGVVVSVLKGLDFEEAAFLSLVLVALVASRRRFYRRGSLLH